MCFGSSAVFFFKQKTAYEIGTGDWSSDVCSSDLKLLGSIQTNLPESVLLDCGMDFLKDDNKKIDTLSVPVDGS